MKDGHSLSSVLGVCEIREGCVKKEAREMDVLSSEESVAECCSENCSTAVVRTGHTTVCDVSDKGEAERARWRRRVLRRREKRGMHSSTICTKRVSELKSGVHLMSVRDGSGC